jgi:hypothetical protein
MNLMRKVLDMENSPGALQIKSVLTRDSLKGYIYVEARSMAHVQVALDKVNNVYGSKIVLVPLEEMVDVLNVTKKTVSLKPGAWVRVSRGKFKGDLAQVRRGFERSTIAGTIHSHIMSSLGVGDHGELRDRSAKADTSNRLQHQAI